MAWASASDVIDAWIGDDVPDDLTLIQTWVDKAEREIRARVPDLQARIDAEAEANPVSMDLLYSAVDVAVAMVIRVFRNPEGIRQVNETTGPYTESRTYGGDIPGGLALSADELEKLRGPQASGAFSVSMIPSTSPFSPAYVAPDVWL